jgi:hypothetical protein
MREKMGKFFLAMGCAFFACAVSSAAVTYSSCGQSRANQAAKIVYTVGNWHDMYKFFNIYGECDEYTVAEGNSDRVSDLLANNWDKLSELETMIRLHPEFFPFVISHIDSLAPGNRLQTIFDNATSRCPEDSSAVCTRIAARTRRLLGL